MADILVDVHSLSSNGNLKLEKRFLADSSTQCSIECRQR